MALFGKRKSPDGSGASPGVDVWGQPLDGGPEPDPGRYVEAFNARMSGMEPEKRDRRYMLLAIAGIAAAVAILAIATVVSCSVTSSGGDSGTAQKESQQPAAQSAAKAAEEASTGSSRFVNIDAYSHLSDESKAKFEQEFAGYLGEAGVPSTEFVMCYSRIETQDGMSISWASCPNGEQFYKVSFDPSSRSFSFEPCDRPDSLPEINYEYEAAQADQAAKAPVYSTGEPVVSQDQAQTEQRSSVSAVCVTDQQGLSALMPEQAASLLAQAVSGYSQTKGRTADLSNCWVPLGTASSSGSSVTFEVNCSDAAGANWLISAEWTPSSGQFGMSLA